MKTPMLHRDLVDGSSGGAVAAPAARGMPRAPSLTGPPRRRRPLVWLLGVALVASGGALAAFTTLSAGNRVPVLAVARLVAAGEPVTVADLTRARIATDAALDPIPAGMQATVVGKHAAVDLVPGTLLTRAELTGVGIPAPGQALVGVSLTRAQRPAQRLRPGDSVLVVLTPPADAAGQPAQPAGALPAPRVARVAGVGPPDADGSAVVDLVTGRAQAAELATDAALGRLSLVLLPSGR